ncbi:O-antigen ligase family protein [Haladaptatus sp. ZSTT2]|uniref:O-antigen ligase family protein n=1 Tax=Haladaptatus sp. ZSTT2 TaxID=3120515 RepID=UPI00300F5629
MVIVGVIGGFSVLKTDTVRLTRANLAFLALYVFLFSSLTWSQYPLATLNRVFDLTFSLLFYFGLVGYWQSRPFDIERWWGLLIWIGLASLSATTLYFVSPPVEDIVRTTSNGIARHLVVFFPLFLGMIELSQKRSATFFFAAVSLLSVGFLFQTDSRSALITLVPLSIGLTLLYAYAREYDLTTSVVVLGICSLFGAVVVVVGLLFGVGVFTSIFSTIPLSLSNVSGSVIGHDRFAMYSLVYELLPEYWLTGVGYGAFQPMMATVHRKGFVIHNVFLRIWLGGGILSLGIFLYVVVQPLRSFIGRATILRGDSRSVSVIYLALGVSFAGILLMGLFNPILTNPLFIVLLALGTTALEEPTQ